MKIAFILLLNCLVCGLTFAGDSCSSSVLGLQFGTGDSYGTSSDFSGTTNHILYYDYKCPNSVGPTGYCLQRSMVNSVVPTCEQFATTVTVGGICPGGNTACLNPGLNWANNNSCGTIFGCDGLDDDMNGDLVTELDSTDRMVFVIYNTTTTVPYASKILTDTVSYDTTNSRYSFNTSVGTNHALYTMPAPSIQTASCSGTACSITVRITEPAFSAAGATGGIYGDDAGVVGGATRGIIAGYKIVAVQSATPPANGLASGYSIAASSFSGASRYIPASRPPGGGNVTSGAITIALSGPNPLYVAYAPIFNYFDSGCTGAVQCSSAQLAFLDLPPSQAPNSLTSRIASPASQPIGPNPVKFVSFRGRWIGSKVKLTWVTASEADLAGFSLFRMEMTGGNQEWVKVNATLIPSQSQGGAGATYTYFDRGTAAAIVKYKVQEVPLSNTPPDSIETTVKKK